MRRRERKDLDRICRISRMEGPIREASAEGIGRRVVWIIHI